VAVAVAQPRAEHEQPAEEHGVARGHRGGRRRGGAEVGQHRRQGGDHNRHAEHVDELDQAQDGDGRLSRHPGPPSSTLKFNDEVR
jgi:hypothetical protein